ncbi:MAG: thioesterase family protein [Sphingobacteriales bacterium]|nr:thioesterase family protein [Sphingobacteriales bacterium]
MARITIDLPEHFHFSTILPVRITDINYGNHLGNDMFLSLLHEARVRFYAHYGYTELNLAGVGTIMADVGIIYKAEVKYPSNLEIAVTAGEFSRAGFEVYYRVSESSSGKVCAIAKTGIVCYDYSAGKIVSVPESFKQFFTRK